MWPRRRLWLSIDGKSRLSPFGYLKLDFVIGVSGWNVAEEEALALHRRQEQVLRQFRSKQLNLLIATSVLEEGVDVRHCNLVLRFDAPKEYRSYVQSRGRARKENSNYIILFDEKDKISYLKKIDDFCKIEKIMEEHSTSASEPVREELESGLISEAEQMMEPYTVVAEGAAAPATVSITTAIALVNRYCAKLPSDIFTKLVPHSTVSEVLVPDIGTLYTASLVLPINSPLKETVRCPHPMKNKKLAQMAVALEACKALHKRGELDNHLLPVGKESVCRLLNELEDDGEVWPLDGRARPGSTKRKQYYDRKVAEALRCSLPEPGKECYLHAVRFKLDVPASGAGNPKNRILHDPADSPRFLALLSLKPLPKIPAFPLFARQGKMACDIETLPVKMTLEDEHFEQIAKFHRLLISDILNLEKHGMMYGPRSGDGVFVVPLQRGDAVIGGRVDLAFVRSVVKQMDALPRKPSDEERQKIKFDSKRFEDAIVMPWYRNEEMPHCFYVADVRFDKNPGEPFPDDKFESFNAYFQQKYKLEIYDQDQPLLDVDYTTTRLNLLLPRNQNRRGQLLRGRDGRGRQQEQASQMQLLVPELVDVHPVPASLWNQIVLLPSFLYRLNYLLLADELRARVQTEAFTSPTLSSDFNWPAMDYAWSPMTGWGFQSSSVPTRSAPSTAAPDEEREDFEIGVWDPSLGEGLTWDPPNPTGSQLMLNGVNLIGGRNGGRSVNGDPMASDDDDDDVLINLEFSRHMMNLGLKPAQSCATSGSLFLEPRDDIQPMGWDSVGAEPSGAGPDGLTLLSVPEELLDRSRLMAELAADASVVAMAGEGGEGAGGGDSAAARAESIAQRQRLLAEMEEDRDAARPPDDSLDVLLQPDSASASTSATYTPPPPPLPELTPPASPKPKPHLSSSKFPSSPSTSKLKDEKMKETNYSPSKDSKTNDKSTHPIMDLEKDLRDEHPHGPSPSLILQALTLSASNDGINLERLETVGDSFLKFATTVYLFNTPEGRTMHEGKLSFMRSKQVSNYYLYRLGKKAGLGELIVAGKLEPHDNWLPPAYVAIHPRLPEAEADADAAEAADARLEDVLEGRLAEDPKPVKPSAWDGMERVESEASVSRGDGDEEPPIDLQHLPPPEQDPLIPPYNILSQQSIADKSMADAVEALIGVYLIAYGPQGALTFMNWLGLRVQLSTPSLPDPLLRFIEDPERQLRDLWDTRHFSKVEEILGYTFKNKAYLVQAFTHASYYHNRITDCYQRLEFLGDAVLDYAITRYLYEDERKHSPGVLTDLRSALVNNTIFASLAVKYGLHKYFMELCPALHFVIDKFVKLYQEKQKEANFDEELYFLGEEEVDEEEDVEVPKSLGDIFESLAGAIYLDSGCSLMDVWDVYYRLMADQLEKCCRQPPKSPIRELLELEPENAKFSKLERLVKEGKVRVTVEVSGRRFTGMGRNYRIAKSTAAKRALRELKAERAAEKAAAAKAKH